MLSAVYPIVLVPAPASAEATAQNPAALFETLLEALSAQQNRGFSFKINIIAGSLSCYMHFPVVAEAELQSKTVNGAVCFCNERGMLSEELSNNS